MRALVLFLCLTCTSMHGSTRGFWDTLQAYYETAKITLQPYATEENIATAIIASFPYTTNPVLCDKLLTLMQDKVTTSQSAMSELIARILQQRIVKLYPYVDDHIYDIIDYLPFLSSKDRMNSWNVVEAMMRFKMEKYYAYIREWSLRIYKSADPEYEHFFERSFVRKVFRSRLTEFYQFVQDFFPEHIIDDEWAILAEFYGWEESESDELSSEIFI